MLHRLAGLSALGWDYAVGGAVAQFNQQNWRRSPVEVGGTAGPKAGLRILPPRSESAGLSYINARAVQSARVVSSERKPT